MVKTCLGILIFSWGLFTAENFKASGRIYNSMFKPIAGASLIYDRGKGTTSDTSGSFILYSLKPGKYKLTARFPGYHKKDTVIEIINKDLDNLVITLTHLNEAR